MKTLILKKSFEPRDIIVFLFFVLFILATYKYVANGETYIFSTEYHDNPIDLNDNVISQEIIIDSKTKWNNKSYAVYLLLNKSDSIEFNETGFLCASIYQNGKLLDSCEIPSAWLENGFFSLKWLDFSKLAAGHATVTMEARDLNFKVMLGLSNNNYNLPNCYINGNDTGYTLTQRYHYNLNDFGYKLSLILFVLLILITSLSMWILLNKTIEIFRI